MLPPMARPDPISLRVRAFRASNRRARRILARLEAEDLQQRRIRWLATKALIVIRQLNDVAEPKVKSMGFVGRQDWQKNYSFIESTLEKIKERGV
jgi:hypothetical protein